MSRSVFKKMMILTLTAAFGLGAAACTRTGIDPNRTQLYVGIYNGGWGREWLDSAVEKFEEKFPEYEIVVTPKKDDYEYDALTNTITSDFNDMYITACSYHAYIDDNKILDISDQLTMDMADVGEPGKTVHDKLLAEYKDFYNLGTEEAPQYYAVPFGSSVWGLNYDVDLFEEAGLYISSSDGSGSNIVWTNGKQGSPAKSAGRDGEIGTYDDGTPVTWAEFQALLRRMKMNNITPFTWSAVTGYVNYIMMSLWADAEGKDNFDLLKTLEGSFTDYQGNTVNLTSETGYNINLMKGKQYALQFIQEVASEGNYSSVAGALSFTEAQSNYIESKYIASEQGGINKRVAFLFDGGHWYNETKAYIEQTNQTLYSEEYGQSGRRFSVMPFPQFDDSRQDRATYLESSHEFSIFVNAQTSRADLAGLFIRFLCTDEILRESTVISGLKRACEYELSEEEIARMPYYYGEVYKLMSSDKVDLVSFRMDHPIYVQNPSLQNMEWVWSGSFVNNKGTLTSLSVPVSDFVAYKSSGLTVEKYMQGTIDSYKNYFEV